MNESFLIRKFELSDAVGASNLFRNVFGIDLGEKYWKWKYFNNPAGRHLTVIAEFNGEIIGQLGAIPVIFNINGKEMIAIQEIDNAIIEKHRNFILYLKLANSLKNNLSAANAKISYGISINETSEIATTMFGKKIVSPIPRLAKVIDVKPFMQKKFNNKAILRQISHIINWFINKSNKNKFRLPPGMQFRQIEGFDKRFDEFWEHFSSGYPIIVKRNADYLNWRYVNHPYKDYKIFCLEDRTTKRLLGYIVLGLKRKEYLIGQIMDFITIKSDNKNVDKYLIKFAIKWFYEKKAAVIRCWMFSHSHQFLALSKAGFRKRPKKGINLIIQSINTDNKKKLENFLSNPINWYISIGDSDMD